MVGGRRVFAEHGVAVDGDDLICRVFDMRPQSHARCILFISRSLLDQLLRSVARFESTLLPTPHAPMQYCLWFGHAHTPLFLLMSEQGIQ